MLAFSQNGAEGIMTRNKPEIIELDINELEEMLGRAQGALDEEDYKTVKAVVESYAYVAEVVGDKNTTIRRLRKLLFGASTEKTSGISLVRSTLDPKMN